MDLTEFSKDNKGLLNNTTRAGRPKTKKDEEKLTQKITVNINILEKEFLDNLNKETGIPASTYLRKKLLKVNAFESE